MQVGVILPLGIAKCAPTQNVQWKVKRRIKLMSMAMRHFAPKDKMPPDKMPQGHFAPRHFAPSRTKFRKGGILPQLQNYGGHFAPTFFNTAGALVVITV